MAVEWLTETPGSHALLNDIDHPDTKWEICVGKDNSQIGLSIQSTQWTTANVIDITPHLDLLIAALQDAKRRLGR